MLKKTGLVIISFLTVISPLRVYADSFREPNSVPSGTVIKIDGSSSLATVNQALAEAFAQKYPNTTLEIQYQGSDAALQALNRGEIDLAAIGRPLNATEQAQGFKSVALPRRKIAIVVSADNSFQGYLTDQQVAAIFRGEITDWSQLGGQKAQIRVIDRPASDTRQSFANYPVFASGEVIKGSNAVAVTEDSTAAITQELGKNGISYTIADQAENNPNLRIIKLFNTPVRDPRYPFSQPRYLVYKDPQRPGVAYFLGFVNAKIGQNAIADAPSSPEKALVAGKSVPSVTPRVVADGGTVSETETIGLPWWLWGLLPLALLAGLFLWWQNRRSQEESQPSLPPSAAIIPPIVTPDALVSFGTSDDTADELINCADSELETILDLPENLAKPMQGMETVVDQSVSTIQDIGKETIPDYPFPSQEKIASNTPVIRDDTVLDLPFLPNSRENQETLPDHPFPVANPPHRQDNTVLDIPDEEEDTGLPSGMPSGVIPLINVSTIATREQSSDRKILTANSQIHCYELDERQLLNLESRSNCYLLDKGIYTIKIAEGYFLYGNSDNFSQEEPLVLIWIFGGRFINRKTKVSVGQTWLSLNGYDDSLDLQVLEPTRLCGLFFDTYAQDNQGQIVLSIIKHEPR
jgi:ABC-type phosphate transport system substrate-binding protein